MFEKEAEERAERKISNFIPQQWGVILIRTEQTYETVEGAPHFYLRSLAKMWKEGAEYGYNKANELHYPSKKMKQKKCKNCKGKGYVPVYFMMAGRAREIEDCPVCKGTGKIETEPKEKRIEELEEKISVLLSCKNCPENKDGLICQKEYENKCLAQKMQFIKELQQENAELKGQVEVSYEVYNNNLDYSHHIEEQLTEAKKVIKNLMVFAEIDLRENEKEYKEAEQFLKEVKE